MPKSTSVVETISKLSTVMTLELETLIAKETAENGCFQGPQKEEVSTSASSSSAPENQGIKSVNVIPYNHSETGGCVLHDDKSCHKIDFTVEIYMNLVENVDMVMILSVSELEPTISPTDTPMSIMNTGAPAPRKYTFGQPHQCAVRDGHNLRSWKANGSIANGLLLSEGLACRIVARSGQPVNLTGLALPNGEGTLEYLLLKPYSSSVPKGGGTFSWTTKLSRAQDKTDDHYKYTEGLDVYNGELFMVSKLQKELFILDLDAQT